MAETLASHDYDKPAEVIEPEVVKVIETTKAVDDARGMLAKLPANDGSGGTDLVVIG